MVAVEKNKAQAVGAPLLVPLPALVPAAALFSPATSVVHLEQSNGRAGPTAAALREAPDDARPTPGPAEGPRVREQRELVRRAAEACRAGEPSGAEPSAATPGHARGDHEQLADEYPPTESMHACRQRALNERPARAAGPRAQGSDPLMAVDSAGQ